MLGQHTYQPQLFSTIDIEEFIPKNHLLRKLDNLLDLSFIRELTEPLYCPDNGRPSIDPELFIRMILVQYFYKIASDRQLCEEIGFNFAYRWFCHLTIEDKVPHHSSLTRIRDRFGEPIFKAMFERAVRECIGKGLVKSGSVMVDGSIFRADASLDSLELIEKDDNDEDDNCSNTRQFNCGINRVKGKKISNQTHISKTDPDCSIAGKEGEVTADSGHGSAENLEYAKSKSINHFIPLWHSKAGKQEPGFTFDRERNCYICTKGNILKYSCVIDTRQRYHIPRTSCTNCSLKHACIITKTDRTMGKFVFRSVNQDLYEEVLKESQTFQFKQKLRERMWKIEGLISEAKNLHLLNRAKYRSRLKVQIQAYITATVQNLKRLLSQDGAIFDFLRDLKRIFDQENVIFHLKLFLQLKKENYSFLYKNAGIAQ